MKRTWGQLLSSASFLVLLVLFAANVIRAHTLGMDGSPPMWVVNAIPPALSDLAFGNRGGYTSLKAVNDVFYASVPMSDRIDGAAVDRAILAVMALNPAAISSQAELLSKDDKGIVDLVKMSFRLFGYKAASPLYLYFVLLFLSALVFALTFNTPFFHTILASFLVAHFLFLPTVFYQSQLQSVLALRFLPVLSMIACLHCILFATRPMFTVLELMALAFQVGLLIFVIHMRSTTMWQVIVVGAVTLLAVGRLIYENGMTRRALQCFIPAIIPILLVMGGLAGLSAYRNVAYDERYFRGEEMLTRVFWHSLFSGLAFNPVLAERYQLKIDDVSIVRAVGRITIETGHASEWDAAGGSSEGFLKLRWAAYDLFAGDAFLELCLHREPGQCIASLIYYKPLSLMRHLSWVYGFRRDVPDTSIFVSAEAGNGLERQLDALKASLDKTGLWFRPWDPIAIFMVVAFAIILFATNDAPRATDVIPGIVLAAGSTIPSLVGFPAMHTIAEPTIAIAASVYTGIAVLLGCGINWQRAGRLLGRMRHHG
jgi:hypothetical protein